MYVCMYVIAHPSLPPSLPPSLCMYLLGMEVMVELALRVSVTDTDSGPCLAVTDDADAVIPQTRADLVVRKAPQYQHLVSDLRIANTHQ